MANFDLNSVVDGFLNGTPSPSPPARSTQTTHITESSVRRKLEKGFTTYTESEIRVIRGLIEQAESDPFSGDAFITPQDLKTLGLKTVDVGAGVDDEEGEEGSPVSDEGSGSKYSIEPMEKFSVTAALCAPDNTVGSNEPIPPEVIATLDVLKSVGEEVPFNTAAPQQAAQQSTPPQASGEPVKDAFDKGVSAASQTNEILQTFESKSGDYLAMANAAIMGEAISEPTKAGLGESSDLNNALNMVRQNRATKKQEAPKYSGRRKVGLENIEGMSPSLVEAYNQRLGALAGSAD